MPYSYCLFLLYGVILIKLNRRKLIGMQRHICSTDQFWEAMCKDGAYRVSYTEIAVHNNLFITKVPPEGVEGFMEKRLQEAKELLGIKHDDKYICPECKTLLGIDDKKEALLMGALNELKEGEKLTVVCKKCDHLLYYPEDFWDCDENDREV